MSATSISSQYLGTAMIPAVTQAQSQLTKLEVESSTGQYADLGLQLGDQNGYELSLRNQSDLLQTLTTANSLTTTNLTTAQNALDAIRSDGQSTAQALTTWTSGANSGATLQMLGSNSLQTLISGANTTTADGQYVFGGVNSGTAPLSDFSSPTSAAATALTQAFVTTFGFSPTDPQAASISASSLQNFLDGPVAAQFTGTNWSTNWSSASNTNASAEISPGQQIDVSANANAPGFQQLAQGYAILAAFGGTSLSSDAQNTLATSASSLISQGLTSLTGTEATLGAAQSQITAANAAMSSQSTLLQTQIGNLDNVNASSVATQLNTLTTQIETAYQITAQIQKLSLAQYLPV